MLKTTDSYRKDKHLMKVIQQFENIQVTANVDMTIAMEQKQVQQGIIEYRFDFQWNEEQAKDPKAMMKIEWKLPCVDVQYMWHPNTRARRVLDGNWRMGFSSMMTVSAPMGVLFNGNDESVYTFATDEVRRVSSVHMGVEDAGNTACVQVKLGLQQFVARSSHSMVVRADYRRIPMHQAMADVTKWWDSILPGKALPVPEVARLPMYSSWYSYHQDIHADELEAECRLAAEMNMHAIIVDDGWQCEDVHQGYGYTGDWEVCEKKIPNMREHVRKVHEAGLKYILWYSVPYVGYHSKAWERFKDQILYRVDRSSCGVLDPRYPEVREYLISIYENAVKEFDLDGFKLDFVDRFVVQPDNVVKPGMDYTCVQEAAERLMNDVVARLKALKPEILIEFRQSYIGPMMRRFGNMFRVGDCAMDIATNRLGTVDLRLLSGNTACHSDMLCWGPEESAEDAALQLLNSMFGVIQFSMIIKDLSEEHRKLSKFWLQFAEENRNVLQLGELIPQEPHFLYPVVEACGEDESIIGVYARDKIVNIPVQQKTVKLMNATKDGYLTLRFAEAFDADVAVRNVFGEIVKTDQVHFNAGLNVVDAPRSGLIEMTRR